MRAAWLVLAATAALAACRGGENTTQDGAAAPPPGPFALYDSLEPLCGAAFAGAVAVDEPAGADPAWQQAPVILSVRTCEPGIKALGIALGEDRSRVLLLVAMPDGNVDLRVLNHADDGVEATLSGYGGRGQAGAAPGEVEFPIDERSVALFLREDQPARGADARWLLSHDPGRRLVFEERHEGRRLRVEFDLRIAVEPPPPPFIEAAVR